MPSGKIDCFLDSNILIHAATGKKSDPRKYEIAYSLVLGQRFGVSGQSLAEFVNVTRKKLLLGDEIVDEWLAYFDALPLVPVDNNLVRAGLMIARRYKISYYDAVLLAAADRLGAPVFYTEDLNHNQVYGSVVAINPFIEH
jgi:predicted nucleic acid-binding protein